MAYKVINKGLKRTALSLALGMCFTGGVYAQSNVSGNVTGQTTAGATVVIENEATGFRREITADANGNYAFRSLPTGTYKVTAGGQTREVTVSIGSTQNIGTVEVVGSGAINPIDVSSVESSTILTAEQVAKIPVARNVTNVALLAPGTVRGDAAFGNLASFGGSSVAENQYYVNGFNISNAFKGLDFGQIPFEAIAEQQVKTGGYGAEFGRSTGGVINLITKRGTNEFHAGANIFYNPESLRSKNPNVYTNAGYLGITNGNRPSILFGDNSKDEAGNAYTATIWASGALVKDTLFAYALLQYGRTSGIETYPNAWALNTRAQSNLNSSSDVKTSPNWLLKMDWNINDNHILELTAFSDTQKLEQDFYVSPTAGSPNSATTLPDATRVLQRGAYKGTYFQETGGDSWSLKYTGYLTDNFTLSALYGVGKSKRADYGVYANGQIARYNGDITQPAEGCPTVTDFSGGTAGLPAGFVPCNFFGALGSPNNEDERKQFRIDADWVIGDHTLRFGLDTDTFTSFDATDLEGGAQWFYYGSDPYDVDGDADYDEQTVYGVFFRNGAEVKVKSKAFYIEDTWRVTDNFLLYGGLRWDTFKNLNGDGDAFVEIKNQLAPRIGFSWDVKGDSTFKIFGNAGRYALPLSSTVAIRGASASLFETSWFNYTGVDPITGRPTGLTKINEHFANGENGQPKDPRVVADQDLKPQYQDEFILGMQMQFTDHLSGGVRAVYRDLKQAIDDFCDYRYFVQWAADNGKTFDTSNYVYCHLYNPGKDSVFFSDVDGDGTLEEIPVPADYYRYLRVDPYDPDSDLLFTPEQMAIMDKNTKGKRTYKAVEFFLEGHWDKFFLQGSYTWAKSSGTFEGGVKSDIGQDDTGTTQDFDYPELQLGAAGFLPNDRRHSLKLFGNWEITEEWSAGFNLLIQSGRPQSCLGVYSGDPVGYRNSYFSCDPLVTSVCAPGENDGVPYSCPPRPGRINNGSSQGNRGDYGRTPWMRNLDLNVAYRPGWADGKLTLKADVFNVFNEHAPLSVWERGESRTGAPMQDTFLIPTSFQAPRSFRFMVQYDW